MVDNNVVPLIPILEIGPDLEERLKTFSTAQLKYMWDGPNSEKYDHICDEIYFEMQRRGEGKYVAV